MPGLRPSRFIGGLPTLATKFRFDRKNWARFPYPSSAYEIAPGARIEPNVRSFSLFKVRASA
jgi:hypothetical protein